MVGFCYSNNFQFLTMKIRNYVRAQAQAPAHARHDNVYMKAVNMDRKKKQTLKCEPCISYLRCVIFRIVE